MMTDFVLIAEGPKDNFVGPCRMALPRDEQKLALEFADKLKCEPGDVVVELTPKNGQSWVSIRRRVVREINCFRNAGWIIDAKECLRAKKAFDLIYPTQADLEMLDPVAQSYSDAFRFSDCVDPCRMRKFRVVSSS